MDSNFIYEMSILLVVVFVMISWLMSWRYPRLLMPAELVNSFGIWISAVALVYSSVDRREIGLALAQMAFQILLLKYFSVQANDPHLPGTQKSEK